MNDAPHKTQPVLGPAMAAVGRALAVAAGTLGKGLVTGWRLLGALDDALFNGFRHLGGIVVRAIARILSVIWSGLNDFGEWLPTRAGRAYSALSGIVLIISGLWVADQLIIARESFSEPGAAKPTAPIDEEDPILARLGGRYVHLSEVAAAAASSGQLRGNETLTPETAFSRGLVESYVEQRLLARAAREDGVQREPFVARRLNSARDRILAAAYLQKRIDAAVTPETVEAFYRSQSDVTRLGDEVKARHIVVATPEEAQSILRALNSGADFVQLAKDRSIDRATAPLGGEIGYFTKDMMTPALAKAAFGTDPGKTAAPFQSEFGWHILEVTDRRSTSGVSFGAVRDNIQRFLTMRTIERALDELRNDENVTYYQPTTNTDLSVPSPGDKSMKTEDDQDSGA